MKQIKLGQRSRNKLTKKQLTELRSKHYAIFERSYQNCMDELAYCKALLNTKWINQNNLFQYSRERVKRLFDYVHEAYPKELANLGHIEPNSNYYALVMDKKARNIKLSFLRDVNGD